MFEIVFTTLLHSFAGWYTYLYRIMNRIPNCSSHDSVGFHQDAEFDHAPHTSVSCLKAQLCVFITLVTYGYKTYSIPFHPIYNLSKANLLAGLPQKTDPWERWLSKPEAGAQWPHQTSHRFRYPVQRPWALVRNQSILSRMLEPWEFAGLTSQKFIIPHPVFRPSSN